MNAPLDRWLAAVSGLLAVCLATIGCAPVPAPPPVTSSSPYVRAPVDENTEPTGEVVATGGYLFPGSESSSVYGEGGPVFRLGDHYDLAVRGRLTGVTAEGNLRLVRGGFELGWLHGVGGFYVSDWSAHLVTGASFQLGADGPQQLFGAVRYAYATGAEDSFETREYIITSVGYRFPMVSDLSVAPELQFATDSELEYHLAPTVSFSAQF